MQPTGAPARLSGHMKLLLAALFALGIAGVPLEQVAACSCAQSTPEQAAEFADVVFAGTVVTSQPVGAETGPLGAVAATGPGLAPLGQTIYTFEVDGIAKGPVGAQVEVLAGGDGASCGMSFGMNERWLVFTTWDGAMHSTGLCSGNVPLEAGGEAPLPLTAPAGDDPTESSGIPVAVLVLIGLLGAVVGVSWLAFRRGPSAPSS
ncbi:MAG: hypothetical protein QOI85_1950 [Chloroflexota bacterium]|nr:hypothetical protein [Chloroflexota bacterium]